MARLRLLEPRLDPPDRDRPIALRLGWMMLIWLLSVAALGMVALILKYWIA
ncbi:MAG: DUF2474 family protein [Sphingomicrobium sp.]